MFLVGFIYPKNFTEVDGWLIRAKMNYDFTNTGRQNDKKFRNNI